MKRSLLRGILVFVLLAGVVLLSANASAQILPFAGAGGNYSYIESAGTGSLSFTTNYMTWVTYTDYSAYDYNDPIANYSTEITFGALTNSSGDPTNFGSSTLTVSDIGAGSNVYFTATIDNFDTNLGWMSLSNVAAGNVGSSSRYVNELLAVGNGKGNLLISFTPGAGGTEDFIGSSSGSVGITVAAPEPISAVLFITGGATLALRRMRKKSI